MGRLTAAVDDGPTPEVHRDKARLAEVGRALGTVNADQRRLYDERLQLWRRLKAAGVPAGELARLAGVEPGTLKTAMAEARRRDERESAPGGG